MIQGVEFMVSRKGNKLVRKNVNSGQSSVVEIGRDTASAKTPGRRVPRKVMINGVQYYRTKRGNLVKGPTYEGFFVSGSFGGDSLMWNVLVFYN